MVGTVVDGFLLSRKIKQIVTERFPKTDQKMGSLRTYGVMRSLSFRFLRMPKPQVKIGGAPRTAR